MNDFDVLLRHARHKNKTFGSPYRVRANGIIIEKINKYEKKSDNVPNGLRPMWLCFGRGEY